jgi:hypothetical protein
MVRRMFEYASVSASAYDVNALVGKLNEKASDGWEVVSIVPTGGDVTAFLKRTPSAATDGEGAGGDFITDETAATVGAGGVAAVSEPAGWAAEPSTSATSEPDTSTESPWSAGAAGAAGAAVSEPEAATTVEAAPTSEPEPSAASAASESAAAGAAATPAATASVPSTPAGWYPDPSGRYEMRYWDGDKWTEHVSRQGQTYTDPPVA